MRRVSAPWAIFIMVAAVGGILLLSPSSDGPFTTQQTPPPTGPEGVRNLRIVVGDDVIDMRASTGITVQADGPTADLDGFGVVIIIRNLGNGDDERRGGELSGAGSYTTHFAFENPGFYLISAEGGGLRSTGHSLEVRGIRMEMPYEFDSGYVPWISVKIHSNKPDCRFAVWTALNAEWTSAQYKGDVTANQYGYAEKLVLWSPPVGDWWWTAIADDGETAVEWNGEALVHVTP